MNTQILIFTNELTLGADGWAQIAPYGDFPGLALVSDGKGGFKKEPAIQRLDKTAITQMVNEYANSRRGLSRFIKSRPLYVGHPDVPGMQTRYPDASPKGVFANLAAREDGFFGEPILTDEGEQLIASKQFRALSGRWEAEPTGEKTARGETIYRPVKFLSAGLTNNPNLPVQLLNEQEPTPTPQNPMNKEAVLHLLAAHGITVANDGDDTALARGLQELGEKIAALTAEKAALANTLAEASRLRSEADAEITRLKSENSQLTDEFANERAARIQDQLEQALGSGRITAAELPDWQRRLGVAAQFTNESAALARLAPKIKTQSLTRGRGDRKIELANARERRGMAQELVAAICAERGWDVKRDYDRAYREAQTLHPALFQAMKQPRHE